MTESTDRRADSTRRQILRAAAHQFARRPYHDVGLDDILAVAELTKGAMYFHFRSKHALALAVIEEQLARDNAAVHELISRQLSGLETLIDISYVMVVHDICRDGARAVLRLLPAIGWTDGLQTRLYADWAQTLAGVIERAATEGDIVENRHPPDLARALLSLYLGLRQSGNLDEPEQFLQQVEKSWAVVLPGIVAPERIAYFSQFIRRRTLHGIKSTAGRLNFADLTEARGR